MATRTDKNRHSLRWQASDIIMGYHSNIPWCCIKRFITCYPVTDMRKQTMSGRRPQYALCDRCAIKGTVNTMHSCDWTKWKCKWTRRISSMLRMV